MAYFAGTITNQRDKRRYKKAMQEAEAFEETCMINSNISWSRFNNWKRACIRIGNILRGLAPGTDLPDDDIVAWEILEDGKNFLAIDYGYNEETGEFH